MACRRDPEARRAITGADLVTSDGMPLVWHLRLSGFAAERVYGPDLMLAAFARSEETGWRHFLYGGAPATLDRLAARLRQRFPRAILAGALSPPFHGATAEEDAETARAINASGADIVWVGLGSPKQDAWMARRRAVLAPALLVGVGAAFDIHAGTLPQAPRALQRAGLEWAFRLAVEPRRLWRRYARDNPAFLLLAAAELIWPGDNRDA
jgi:N-acetylglucosaminyldiphosphoundecaprenol N-acetyl-beta-D-mannosaminyltransferase